MLVSKLQPIFNELDLKFNSENSIYIYLRNKSFLFGDFILKPDFINQKTWLKFDFFEKYEFWYLFSLYLLYDYKKKDSDFNELLNLFLIEVTDNSDENLSIEDRINKRIFNRNKKNKFIKKDDFNILFFVDYFAFNRYLDNTLSYSFVSQFKSEIKELLTPLYKQNSKNRNEKYFWSKLMNNKEVRNNKKNKEMLLLNLSEKKYRFEIFYLSIWLDMDFSLSEQETMKRLNPKFALDKSEQMESIVFIEHYIFSEQNRIFHFHPKIKQIKERFLINIKSEFAKNKERIIKEISESKELLFLLRKSTQKKLNKEEKTKIREQLMDILKVIPSFSILMLPAGTVILPLILKILPKKTLYPSSFLNDNFEINIDKDD